MHTVIITQLFAGYIKILIRGFTRVIFVTVLLYIALRVVTGFRQGSDLPWPWLLYLDGKSLKSRTAYVSVILLSAVLV